MKKCLSIVALLFLVAACASKKVVDLTPSAETPSALIQSSSTVLFKYIDDDEVPSTFIGQTRTYKVPVGQRTVIVEYSDLFEATSDEHDKLVSRPAKVTFELEAGNHYQIVNPPQKTLEQAQEFLDQPDFFVINTKTGEKISAKVELSRPRSFLTSLKSSVAPVYEFESDKVAPNSAPVANVQTGHSRLYSLQELWKNADQAERDAFLNWVKQQ